MRYFDEVTADTVYSVSTRAAMAGAAFMMAHQVAGKAARDALFLSKFPASDLPKIVALAAMVAILMSLASSAALSRFGPRRIVPFAFGASGALHVLEWMGARSHPEIVPIFVYLHVVGLGALLLSGFWALANEMFDPHEAKARFGRIAGAGTAGGIVGGLLAERSAALFSAEAILVVLAALHVGCGVMLLLLGAGAQDRTTTAASAEPLSSAPEAYRKAPYLASLTLLVFLGTTAALLIDFLFKSGAVAEYGGKSPALLRYFAMFYTAAQVLTFLVQAGASRFALERLGLSRTVGSLPLAVAAGSGLALAVPSFGMVASLRAIELILRGSLFRAGYELFYTPIPAREKRPVKVLIDVGSDRLGDAFGALLVQIALWVGSTYVRTEILVMAVAASVLAAFVARTLDKAYSTVLERGLVDRAIELDLADVHDSTTMSTVLRTVGLSKTATVPVSDARTPAAPARPVDLGDPVVTTLIELRCGDKSRVLTVLKNMRSVPPEIVPQLIRLLAWDDVRHQARKRLVEAGAPILGQLADALLDPNQDFAIRRRIPAILAMASGSSRAASALIDGLSDSRFEVRFQCGRSLDYLRQHSPALAVQEGAILAAVDRELSVSKPIWDSHRLLDRREMSTEESGAELIFLDEILRERANQSLEHVFSLLAAILPREPLRIAFRSLHTEDRRLRGLALEYLESVLPAATRVKLWAVVGSEPSGQQASVPREVADQLLASAMAAETIALRMAKSAVTPAPPGGDGA